MSYDPEQFQKDVEARLNNLPFFSDVTVIRDTPGVIDNDILNALSTLNEKAGKNGTCVVVKLVEEVVPDADLGGPQTELEFTVRFFTDALINLGENGTKKSNAAIRRAARRGLHHWSPNGSNVVYCDKAAGSIYESGIDGIEGYDAKFRMPLPDDYPTVVQFPRIAIAGALPAITVTLTGPVGAEIRYTTDGSFPDPVATLYSAPFLIAAACTIRAAAYVTGEAGSSIAVQQIT